MSKRWQYLIKAHVPAAKAPSDWNEQITLDKWEPKYPPMKRGLGLVLSAAILAGSCFLVPPSYGNNFSNPALPDKWKATYVDYHYKKPTLSRAIQPTNAVIVPPVAPSDWKERITLDKWKPTYVDYYYRKPFLSRAIQSGSLFWVYWPPPSGEIITVDKWLPNYPNQLLPKISPSRAIQSGSLFYQYISGYVYQGQIGFSLSPTSPSIHDFPPVIGAVVLAINPSSICAHDSVYSGSVMMAVIPASSHFANYPFAGAIPLSLIPSSTFYLDWPNYNGAISVTLNVNAPIYFYQEPGNVYRGDVILSFLVLGHTELWQIVLVPASSELFFFDTIETRSMAPAPQGIYPYPTIKTPLTPTETVIYIETEKRVK